MRFLEPVHLARLRNLRLGVRRAVATAQHGGSHRGRARGRSQEFSEHREYVPGDELKLLDWKVYARQDRYFVREHQEERSLRTCLLADASGSMGFSDGGRPSKWELSCRCAAALAFLVLSRSDAAGLELFGDGRLARLPPRTGLPFLQELDAALAAAAPTGPTRLAAVLTQFAAELRRRSWVVLLSDLLGPPEETVAVLRSLRARGHEVLVLRVLDPVERDLGLSGPVLFEDLEGPLRLRCDVEELRRDYRREFERGARLFEGTFRSSGIAFETLWTDRDWEEQLVKALARQGLLG